MCAHPHAITCVSTCLQATETLRVLLHENRSVLESLVSEDDVTAVVSALCVGDREPERVKLLASVCAVASGPVISKQVRVRCAQIQISVCAVCTACGAGAE